MPSQSHPRLPRSLAIALTALAVGAPSAIAQPIIDPPARTSEQAAQTLASRGVGAPVSTARANVYVPPAAAFTDTATRQAKANVYVPPAAAFTDTAPTPATHTSAPRVQSTDTGLDWGSAGIGAAAIGGLVLVAVGGFGLAYRARIRLAR
jgi:hypothetical protein